MRTYIFRFLIVASFQDLIKHDALDFTAVRAADFVHDGERTDCDGCAYRRVLQGIREERYVPDDIPNRKLRTVRNDRAMPAANACTVNKLFAASIEKWAKPSFTVVTWFSILCKASPVGVNIDSCDGQAILST
jgi:hypothetical protein